MDAAAAFHRRLEVQRAAMSPNQLKKQRKKRAKLFKQAADTGTAQWCGPSKHMTMESEQEESVALQASNSRLILQPALQLSSSCQLTGSITSEAGTAAAVDAAEVSQQQQPPPKKRRSTLLRPLKPFKPHHSNQADPRAQASDMSAVMKALQQPANLHSHEQKQPYLHPQEVTAASAEPAAAATESQCSQESFRASNAVHQATHAVTSHNSSANRGPCRTDLSKHLVVINQQLSSDHSSSTALVASSAQSSQLKQQQQQLDAAGQQPEQQQGGQEQVSRKRQRPSCLYGNYHHYYGYRIGPSGFEDPRMKVLDPDWFRGADVLDVGCNEGLLTLALAVGCGCRSMLGVDIDPGLVAKACTNLSRSRTQLTQQFREAVTAGSANAGRRAALPGLDAGQQASGTTAVDGPLGIIAAASAALGVSNGNGLIVEAREAKSSSSNINSSSAVAVQPPERLEAGQPQKQLLLDQKLSQQPQEQQVPHPIRQEKAVQHKQQQPYSLQGRVVQLDRQLKALSRVSFKCGNWLDLGCATNKYGVVTCFSVTKWIHLNWGDDGLMKLFHKFFRCLVPGGVLILEPQPFKSYQNAVHKAGVHAAPFKKIGQFKLRPEAFCDFLTQRVGFELVRQMNAVSQVAGDQAVPVKGFDRPIIVLRKPVQ